MLVADGIRYKEEKTIFTFYKVVLYPIKYFSVSKNTTLHDVKRFQNPNKILKNSVTCS